MSGLRVILRSVGIATLIAAALALLASPPMLAASGPVLRVFGRIGNVVAQANDYVVYQVTGALPEATSNTVLEGYSTALLPMGVMRLGYAAAGDAAPLFFKPGSALCSLNSGSGDGGSQVPSSNGKCWLAVFPATGADVREFGAKGDSSTDDNLAIQSDIAAIAALGGGIVDFSSGSYCAKEGLSVTSNYVRLVGEGKLGAGIFACGANVALVTLDAGNDTLENLFVDGSPIGASNPAVTIGSACVECKIDAAYISGGTYPILDVGVDTILQDSYAGYGYGSAIVKTGGSPNAVTEYQIRLKLDQALPGITPSLPITVNAWAANTVYGGGRHRLDGRLLHRVHHGRHERAPRPHGARLLLEHHGQHGHVAAGGAGHILRLADRYGC